MLQRIMTWRNNQTVLLLLLFVLGAAPYVNTYHNRFTYDDTPILSEDHRLRSLNTIPALFTRDYFMTPDHNLYRPLPMVTIAANFLLFGESPWSYRIVNQVLHGLNVIILFLFLGNFYRLQPGIRFLAAAIFAVHPAATEAVNLIVYRAELLAFGFSLAAFHLYLQKGKNRYSLPGSAAFYFLAMLSKESAMILPLFMLLHHLYFERNGISAFVRSMTGFFVAALLVAGMRYWALGAFGPQHIQQFFYGIPWTSTLFTMIKVIAYYWKIVVWPSALQMNYDFADFPVASSLFDVRVLLSLSFELSVLTAAAVTFRKNKALSYFILWPFIALLPVMNILVPSGVLIAVRLMYLAMAGYSVLLAAVIYGLKPLLARVWHEEQSVMPPRVFTLIVGCYILLLAAMTLSRNADFKNNETLFRKDLLLSPNNTLSMRFLAPELPPDEAEALLTRALQIRPLDSVFLSMLGEIYEGKGNHAAAETLQRRSLEIEPTYRAHKQLGVVLSNTGRLREAEAEFRKVIELKPYWSTAYEDLAIVQYRQGQREEAWELLQKAVLLNPDSADAYNLIGVYHKDRGDYFKAVSAFQRSIELSRKAAPVTPRLYEAMFNLADTYEKIDPRSAIRAWADYIRAAESLPSEEAWVSEARSRIAGLSQTMGR